jgi:hypothetical protein
MLQVARLAPKLLGDSTALVADFVRRHLNPDGGFRDRAGASDLYYTVFGLQGLVAVREELPVAAVLAYLKGFGNGDALDFVHAACLARCWAMMPAGSIDESVRTALAARLAAHRTSDQGYHASAGAAHGNAYHGFLALGAYQDLRVPVPAPEAFAASLETLKSADGAYANEPDRPRGSTPATAAAVVLMRYLDIPPDERLAAWLFERCRDGGFFATPDAPMPDLLSTATALHALSSLHAPLDRIREACLDFVDSLWTSEGGFYGTWADDTLDCEYTYYGLLALGHLAV